MVSFSVTVEWDFLQFNSGTIAEIGISENMVILLYNFSDKNTVEYLRRYFFAYVYLQELIDCIILVIFPEP